MTLVVPPEPAIQVIDQPSATLNGIVGKPEKTIGSVMYEVTVNFPAIALLVELPASFVQGLRDCAEGRTVDMETAMSQRPPDRAV